jgi:hypothetical protein
LPKNGAPPMVFGTPFVLGSGEFKSSLGRGIA